MVDKMVSHLVDEKAVVLAVMWVASKDEMWVEWKVVEMVGKLAG